MLISFEEFAKSHPELKCVKFSQMKDADEAWGAMRNGFTVIFWA